MEQQERYGDAGLRLLAAIQDACPEAGIASGLILGSEILLREYKAMKLQNDELRNALEEIRKLEGPGLDGSSENRSGKIARLALEGHHGNCDLFDPFGRDKPCNCKQIEKRVQPSPKCEHVWEADGDRDVCKKCGTRANPVM